jgi:hypothetical protein
MIAMKVVDHLIAIANASADEINMREKITDKTGTTAIILDADGRNAVGHQNLVMRLAAKAIVMGRDALLEAEVAGIATSSITNEERSSYYARPYRVPMWSFAWQMESCNEHSDAALVSNNLKVATLCYGSSYRFIKHQVGLKLGEYDPTADQRNLSHKYNTKSIEQKS